MHACIGIERLPQQKFRPFLCPKKFEVRNILVAKFVSRTIVDSFLAHLIITISDLPYSNISTSTDHKVIIMYVLTTNFHRQLVHGRSPIHFSRMVVWTICTSPFLFEVINFFLLCLIACALKYLELL